MCRSRKCGNCQQKQNPTPQQIKRFPFPQCQLHINSEHPWQIFLFFSPSSQIHCQQILENANCMTFVGKQFKSPGTSERNTVILRDPERTLQHFPTNQKSHLEVSEWRQWPQTQLKDTLTGLFNTKRRPFLWRAVKPSWKAALQTRPLWQPSRCRR